MGVPMENLATYGKPTFLPSELWEYWGERWLCLIIDLIIYILGARITMSQRQEAKAF